MSHPFPPTPVHYLSQVQLARRWGISPRSLERWRWAGRGPAYVKVGAQVRYRLEDIETYEQQQRHGQDA